MQLVLALIPTLILLGPIFWLIKSEKRFDQKYGAISDLNNFKSSKLSYVTLLALWEISLYVFIIMTFQNLFNISVLVFTVLILAISLITLPISSHKKEHILPQIISCLFAILITIYVALITQKYHMLVIDLLMLILIGHIALSMFRYKKISYWRVEMLIGGLIGLWSLLILF